MKQSSYKLPYDALSSAFATFGRLLATRQTLALMATALVICSLLSPAILLTFSPSGSPFDISASAITRRGRGELLWELEGMRRQGLISTEEDVCWDRVKRYYEVTGREGGGRRIRVEQILVSVAGPRGIAGSKGSIGKGVLHRAWRVEKEIERRLLAGEVPGNRCLSVTLRGEKRCAVLSPAAWWKDEDALLQDDDVHRTLSGAVPGANVSKIPLTLSEAFVGIGRDRQVSFPHPSCSSREAMLTCFNLVGYRQDRSSTRPGLLFSGRCTSSPSVEHESNRRHPAGRG